MQARIPAAAQIAESLAEHAVARPAAMTGGHYTEISLVYFIEVNRVLTGEQDGASAVARIGEQVAVWVEGVAALMMRGIASEENESS